MTDYLQKYAVRRFINAHDTVTNYGGSRMAQNTLAAMQQISATFVDLAELQRGLSRQMAALTHNEAAYITGGAAAGVQLATAVCLAKGSEAAYRRLPDTAALAADECLVLHPQHHCYNKAIEAAGGRIRFAGDADGVPLWQLAAAIGEKTAAVFYAPSARYAPASPALGDVVRLAHEKGVPVVVDAAAQLPPAENLWNFTAAGADMVIFSGGKTLCGPQASGLVLGREKWLADCHRFGAPVHGVCRAAKVSREGMLGLAVALENFLAADHAAEWQQRSAMVDKLVAGMAACLALRPYRVEHGSVGQSYPRAFATVQAPHTPDSIRQAMYERQIFIGAETAQNAITVSPQNLTPAECETVIAALQDVCGAG